MFRPVGSRAVVLGGSVAGLLAARTLADQFEQVEILERDQLPTEAGVRKGVPQGRQTHGLLASGLLVLEDLFPGIREELVRRGATMGDGMARTRWHVGGDWHVQFESGLFGICQSRPLLEQVVRERVAAAPNITIRERINLDRLVPGQRHDRVVAVQVTDRVRDREETIAADLVVDATGRGSRTPARLEELGYDRPPEERVEIDLSYATRIYHRQAGDFQGNMAVVIAQSPPNKRFAVAAAVEGNRWSVTIGGMHDDQPPDNADGFYEFARGLPSPVFHDFLTTAEPLSDVMTMKYPASVRRRYERLKRFPAGLIVLGDALCSFNPIYGQGMSVAALEARLLGECTKKGLSGLWRRYFRKAAAIVDVPWQIAVTADLRFPHVRGTRSWSSGVLNAYMQRLNQAAHQDPVVCLAFHRVANLLDPPMALFHPRVLRGIARNWWNRGATHNASALTPCTGWSD